MNDFLAFRKMITPAMIQVIFWIGVAAILVTGVRQLQAGAGPYGGVFVLQGLMTLILGPLFWRIGCELMILLFRIYDRLGEINRNVGGRAPE